MQLRQIWYIVYIHPWFKEGGVDQAFLMKHVSTRFVKTIYKKPCPGYVFFPTRAQNQCFAQRQSFKRMTFWHQVYINHYKPMWRPVINPEQAFKLYSNTNPSFSKPSNFHHPQKYYKSTRPSLNTAYRTPTKSLWPSLYNTINRWHPRISKKYPLLVNHSALNIPVGNRSTSKR